ncbi:hypothetical protein Hanom_Chr00s113247g01808491 [Helianthus anomalus]
MSHPSSLLPPLFNALSSLLSPLSSLFYLKNHSHLYPSLSYVLQKNQRFIKPPKP